VQEQDLLTIARSMDCEQIEQIITILTMASGQAVSDQCKNADWQTIHDLLYQARILLINRSSN
jgi:hypothetical protein